MRFDPPKDFVFPIIGVLISVIVLPFSYGAYGALNWNIFENVLFSFVGVLFGFFAMARAEIIALKIVFGLPTALNSIVLLYFLGMGVLYYAEH